MSTPSTYIQCLYTTAQPFCSFASHTCEHHPVTHTPGFLQYLLCILLLQRACQCHTVNCRGVVFCCCIDLGVMKLLHNVAEAAYYSTQKKPHKHMQPVFYSKVEISHTPSHNFKPVRTEVPWHECISQIEAISQNAGKLKNSARITCKLLLAICCW